ncbi:N-acetylglucosaminyl transferase [Thiohalobacter thiocyanaticus]|uniref:Lipopolysaccharide assembly protein B n=1 Tax=Thiohalobacter thiocyanaticus TaxID=585455 RepID=A0A1Z4VST9_9GAMM|nr:lipopolysaccharide assembly protein LapB [Thiohalobacter thiocyanaticus]BAZ94553.1 N-acetylglucosaminyl transferase [Thiohalobacter thiocyanaticus]
MSALLWLLLPVAAASGWLLAVRSERRRQRRPPPELNEHYFKGLNLLLNEQPDKAIEVFVDMLEVDSDTVETHMALGNLFRRRGEVDRAIRIHQNLIARPTLERDQRNTALLELSRDYMRAGLFDRAENLLQELLDTSAHAPAALGHLLDIYQQEKEWDKAIQVARRLEGLNGRHMHPVVAQFHCEQAEQAMRHGDAAGATRLLKRALNHDPNCVRASLLQARLAREAGDHRTAVQVLKRIEKQDIDFLPEALPELKAGYTAQGAEPELMRYLQEIAGRYRGVTPALMLSELIEARDGAAAAVEYLTAYLRERPSIRGLERMIHLDLGSSEGRAREDLLLLRDLTARLLEDRPRYRCHNCGFEAKALHWQCPGCKEWNRIKPIYGVEGE